MNRLLFVITYVPDIGHANAFYRDLVGLRPAVESPVWVHYESDHASLALLAVGPGQPTGIELCFDSRDLEADVAALRARGVEFMDSIREESFGRVIHLKDPDGNVLSLLTPANPPQRLAAPPEDARFTMAIVNCRDVQASKSFYRDRLGLRASVDSPWWVEFESDGTRLALHPRVERPEREHHHGTPITLGFAAPDLPEWAAEASARGFDTLSDAHDDGFGLRAEAVDPNGYALAFSEAPAVSSLEEELAEPYESDAVPRSAAMRKPVKKGAAGSRLALRPEYKVAKQKAAAGAAKPKPKRAAVASPRGTGPAGTRKKPKTRKDVKRAKAKPAIGRLHKAERRSASRKKSATASASKRRPVKRAATRGAKSRGARAR